MNTLDSVSRAMDAQGELKPAPDGVKVNKYKIEYNGNTKRIQGKNGGTEQADLEAGAFSGQTLRLPDPRKFGFQYRSPRLGGIGFDTFVRKPNEQTQEWIAWRSEVRAL